MRTLWALLLFLAACSGGGGNDPTDSPASGGGGDDPTNSPAPVETLALLAVEPEAIVTDEPATLTLECVIPGSGAVELSVEGAGSFPCAVDAEGNATCALPAGALAAGEYDLTLVQDGDVSAPLRNGLRVTEFRDFEGAGVALLRLVAPDYADGDAALAGADRANPRVISNLVCAQEESRVNELGATDFVWQWGQFLDHDIDLTLEAEPEERADIAVPAGDPWFDPNGTGAVVLAFHRSAYVAGTSPREQVNDITALIDASNVYGSDDVRAAALRTLDGTGRLKTSPGALLPFNTDGLPNAGGTGPDLFLAGDIRANEQVALTCMHTLFVREHNRLADEIRAREPDYDGDRVYEEARRIVGAQMQVITYREFLPILLGPGALAPYRGYDDTVDPNIANVFSTGSYRLGHSLLSSFVLRLDAAGAEIDAGHLALRDAFFNPDLLTAESDLDPVLRGLAAQAMQDLDVFVIDDVRNFLFGPPGAGGLDLPALNIQRGRDHGLPPYNAVRVAFGLDRRASFDEVSSDPEVRDRLAAAYASVDDIDVWVGGLAEDHRPGALVGELMFFVLRDQFERLRDGDRFWYERTFSGSELDELRRTRLSDIIRRNTGIGDELPDDVFRLADTPRGGRVAATAADPLEPARRRRIERIAR